MVFFYESFMILKQKIEGIYTDIQGYNDLLHKSWNERKQKFDRKCRKELFPDISLNLMNISGASCHTVNNKWIPAIVFKREAVKKDEIR